MELFVTNVMNVTDVTDVRDVVDGGKKAPLPWFAYTISPCPLPAASLIH